MWSSGSSLGEAVSRNLREICSCRLGQWVSSGKPSMSLTRATEFGREVLKKKLSQTCCCNFPEVTKCLEAVICEFKQRCSVDDLVLAGWIVN